MWQLSIYFNGLHSPCLPSWLTARILLKNKLHGAWVECYWFPEYLPELNFEDKSLKDHPSPTHPDDNSHICDLCDLNSQDILEEPTGSLRTDAKSSATIPFGSRLWPFAGPVHLCAFQSKWRLKSKAKNWNLSKASNYKFWIHLAALCW